MSEHPCCVCCEGIAKSDHVGHGGSIEKDQHDGPCDSCELEKLVGPIVADRTATLARELAEARERLARVEAAYSDLANEDYATDLAADMRVAVREALALWVDDDALPYATRSACTVIGEVLLDALHAPADAPPDEPTGYDGFGAPVYGSGERV